MTTTLLSWHQILALVAILTSMKWLALSRLIHPTVTRQKKTSYEQQSEQIKSVESLTITSLERELEGGPYQPMDVGHLEIPKQNLKGKVRHFQSGWFVRYPWLHYSSAIQAALCYPCAKADMQKLTTTNTKSEQAFISTGFSNWKKAIERFSQHEQSSCHRHAVSQLQQINRALSSPSCLHKRLQNRQLHAQVCSKYSVPLNIWPDRVWHSGDMKTMKEI
jgi:excinuclease UvrABC ATPase subunit